MPYTLIEKNPAGDKIITKNLESFWLFYKFRINQATKTIDININNGFCAVYISQQSGTPTIQSLYNNATGLNDRELEITNQAKDTIIVKKLRLVNSRFSQFSNEMSQLHLFEFSPALTDIQAWINTQGWTPGFINPTKNDDGRPFIEQTLSLAEIQKRHIYWLSTESNNNGTAKLVLTIPFVSGSLLGKIISLNENTCPEIQVSVDSKDWTYAKSASPALPGAVNGFVMVAEGAFRSIALSGEIDDIFTNAGALPFEQVMVYLSKVVQRYPTPFSRTLVSVANTKSNSVVQATPELPVEVLYLEGLNTVGSVDLII